MFEGRAWQASEFGAPRDVLKQVHGRWSEPPEGAVLVRVRACGVGLPDLMMTRGVYPLTPQPPVTPGQEVAGEVVAVRSGSPFVIGDHIMGMTMFASGSGGYAEYAFLHEFRCRRVPSSFSDEEAAGFFIAYRTAYAALVERVPLQRGQVLLVLGAAGSSGAAAIDMGKSLGASVIAVAGGAEKLEFCRAIGADHVVDYRSADVEAEVKRITNGRGADVIFDPVGGELATVAVKAIARNGRIAIIGFASGAWIRLDPLDMVLRNYTAIGVFAGGMSIEEDKAAYDTLCAMAERGEIKPALGKSFAFEEVAEVVQLLESGAPAGKLVVRL